MPKYLVKQTGKHIDVVHIPKNLSEKNQKVIAHNRQTIFKGYKEINAPSQSAAINKAIHREIKMKKVY